MCRFLVQVFGCVSLALAASTNLVDTFPWAAKLVPDVTTAVRIARSPCCANRTYKDLLQTSNRLMQSSNSERLFSPSMFALGANGREINRHLWACGPAVVLSILWRAIFLMRNFDRSEFSLSTILWQTNWAEIQAIWTLTGILTCHKCDSHEVSAFGKAMQDNSHNQFAAGIHHLQGELTAQLYDFQARNSDSAFDKVSKAMSSGGGAKKASEQQQFAFIKKGQALMERMRSKGLLHAWVIGRSTLIYSLRYGSVQPKALPSGHKESARASDVDIYVHTNDFAQLATMVATESPGTEFTWCGWQVGWSSNSFFCVSLEGEAYLELEFTSVDQPYLPVMVPTITCQISDSPESTETPESLALPCPNDPIGFMRLVWSHFVISANSTGAKEVNAESLTACFALPMGLSGKLDPLQDDDVRFIWSISSALHSAGFASMTPYFQECRNHPMSALAQSISKDLRAL